MIKTFINGSAESVEYTDTPSFNTPPSNVGVYMLASVDAISPPDAREWDFTVDIPSERISTLPNGYTIMIADTREAIESGFGYKTLFKKSEYYGIEHYRIKVNAPFYIGVGNTDVAISPGDLSIYTVETFLDSHFTFSILGESANCILFKDDTEPCAVYVNGERQDNISYIPKSAEGADSVSYKSEYKNNLRTLQIEGNTEQDVPNAYRAVEYIESTGTEYIDTGFKPNQDTKVEIKCQYNSTTYQSIFGSNPLFVLTTNDGNYRFRYNSSVIDTTVFCKVLSKLTLDKNKAYLNDELVGTFTEATFQSPYNALLFARSTSSGGIEEKCSAKLYYAKLWDNGTLIRDFIPCYRKSDNVIGLYDLVNGVFYTNQGTGTFLKGADVSTQTGTTTNPTIANPQAIINCGNGQIEVDVKGVNLYDISKVNGADRASTTTPDVAGNASYGTVTDGVLNLKRAYYDRGIIWTGAKIPINQGGNYYISTDIYIDQSIVTTATEIVVALKNITKQTISQNRVSSQITVRDTWVECSFDAISIPDTWVGDDVYLLLQASGDRTQYFNLPIYAKNIMISYGEALPYQPYFNSTVSIPANVVLESGANETLLELAKIGNIADTITIDRVNNEVKYIQRICRVRPFVNVGGTLEYGGSAGGNPDEWLFPLNKNAQVGIGKCEFSPITNDVGGENEFSVIIYDTVIVIYTPKSLGLNTPQALESYLMQTGKFGLSIFYALETTIERTITDEMEANDTPAYLKTNLLDWAKNTKNQTNIIEITSTPSVSKTSVNYAKWGGVPNENNT